MGGGGRGWAASPASTTPESTTTGLAPGATMVKRTIAGVEMRYLNVAATPTPSAGSTASGVMANGLS